VWFDHPERHAYVRVTPELYAQIQSGAFKL
jgi:hypothetical protein